MCLGPPKNTSSGNTETFVIIENIFIYILNIFLSNLNGLRIVNSRPKSEDTMSHENHENSVFMCSQQDFSLNY